jgi:hypothetical protein
MIHYVTSVDHPFTKVVREAKRLRKAAGLRGIRYVEQAPHLSAWEEICWGDVLIQASKKHTLYVAATSENALLRILRRVREAELSADKLLTHVVCMEVTRPQSGVYVPRQYVRTLRCDASGEYLDRWPAPHGFFDVRMAELF